MTRMPSTPARARCHAVLTPMAPPPMIVTEAYGAAARVTGARLHLIDETTTLDQPTLVTL